MQQLFRPLTGTSDLSIAISTLAVAAFFGPVRVHLQTFIDRRFYRGKYDATQTVETFSARLRDEVDIDSLTDDLLTVVQESMQPRSVSLWLWLPPTLPLHLRTVRLLHRTRALRL